MRAPYAESLGVSNLSGFIMHNMFHSLQRAAIYAGAKPETARPTGMQILRRDKSGNVTKLRDHDALTHEVTRKTIAPAAHAPSAAPMSGVPFVPTRNRTRSTGLTWDK
jgi:hypothetical protein